MLDDTQTTEESPDEQKVMPREAPEVTAARRKLVKKWQKIVEEDKKHHEPAFKRIEEDLNFAYRWGIGEMWPNQNGPHDERYIANIVQRHVGVRLAALYARDPTVVAKPARRREFRVWDGNMTTLNQAMMTAQQAALVLLPPPPDVQELLMDAQEGLARQEMIANVGETLEILYSYFMREQDPDFKGEMKQAVLRALSCGVAWVRLGYQRMYAPRSDKESRLSDVVEQMQIIERLRADVLDKEVDEESAEYETLRLMLQEIESEPEVIVREGLVWDFPQTTRIVPAKCTTNIRSLKGATHVTEWFEYTNDEIKEIYGVDVSKSMSAHRMEDPDVALGYPVRGDDEKMCVGKIYDKKSGLCYVICEDYIDFLAEPAPPEIRVERFFPFYSIVFNRIEHPKEIYPAGDIRLLRHQQREYNRKKEGERQHRIANRPLYAVASGKLEDDDLKGDGKVALDNYPAHAVLPLKGLAEGEKVSDVLQPVQKVPIDPNLYESEGTFNDILRVVGSQEATLGGTSNSTATESSIAESTRLSSLDSNVDDLDDVLTMLARDGGGILLGELSAESAMEIVGPGAVWPELDRATIQKEIYLDIEAGSSGRPNQARDIQNFKEMGPLMMQIPGQDPEKLARYGWKVLNPKFDPNEMLLPGMPSITALNGMMQPPTGDPMTDPNAQGPEGANKNERPPESAPAPGPTTRYDATGQRVA